MPSRNQLTVYPSDTLRDLVKALAKENHISESKVALHLIEYAIDHGYDVKRLSAELEVDRLRKDSLRLQDALRKAEEDLKNIPTPVSDESVGQIADHPSSVFGAAQPRAASPAKPRESKDLRPAAGTERDRTTFRNLIKPILDRDSSVQPKAKKWWVDHAVKYPEWFETDTAELSDDGKDELRALVQEASHG